MDTSGLFEIFGVAFSLVGAGLVAYRKPVLGYALMSVSCGLIGYALLGTPHVPLVLQNLAFFVINIFGLVMWSRRPNSRATEA